MMLTKFILTTPIAVAATGSLFAAANADSSASLQSQVDAIRQENVHGTVGGKNPMHNINGAGIFVTADFLYWKADEDGLEYAYKSDSIPGAIPVKNGKLKDVGFEWEPGFRLGMGYPFNYDGWDTYLNWTHIHPEASSHASNPDVNLNSLSPIWLPSSLYSANNAEHASAHWDMGYDTLDLELGRNYFASKALSYRPFVGIRGAWLLQDYSNKVRGGNFLEEPSTAFHAHNDYRGWGLRAGFKMLYHFCKSWALYGDISGSLLWGDFHVNSKWHGNNPSTDVVETLFREKEGFHRVRTNVEVGLGLMWETFFHKDKMHVAFTAGYELTQWFMQNKLRQFIGWGGTISDSFNVPQSGDLGLQGLTVSGRLDF